ncbi:MAG: MBL fold metallo-hydrolase [Clostridiales bacterium]|nr:MBL fold metallo-hydrolase [Clostridiales bacterium]
MNKKRIFALIVSGVILSGCQLEAAPRRSSSYSENAENSRGVQNNRDFQDIQTEGLLSVKYIDVGQADSILITTPSGSHMLIDAGAELGAEEYPVREALSAMGSDSIDIAVATHPHYDHIAEMDYVIENYDIGTFYLPDTEDSYTSKTYTAMLEALEENGVTTVYPDVPSEFELDGVSFEILNPTDNETRDCNEYSLVIKMTYGENTFLFTGDAGSQSEYNMIDRGFDLSAEVLKVGHHGSAYSTTREFLDEVQPKYAVISCGRDNSYGHPAEVALSRLEGIETYITMDCGDIIITSDGENTEIYTEEENGEALTETAEREEENGEAEEAEETKETYIGNINSKVFHSETCGSLPNEENRAYFSSKEEALEEGYKAHSCVDIEG